jgi:hypothetical protein
MSSLNIRHHVSHIFQEEDGLCWASAIAMVLGRHSLEGAYDVARRAGITRADLAIQDSEIVHAISANGLSRIPVPGSLTADALAGIVRPSPAVFFVSLRPGFHASNGGNHHVIVIRGIIGDGSGNTSILVNDPWTDEGDTRTLSFLTSTYWFTVDHIARRR